MKLTKTLILAAAVLAALIAWLAYALLMPLPLPETPYEFEVKTGTSMKGVARQLTDAGVLREPFSFEWLARFSGRGSALKAGSYALDRELSAWELLEKLTRGDVSETELKLIEGWNFRQFRAALDRHPDLTHTTSGMSDAQIMARLGLPGVHPEGRFFPDTYYFSPGMSDLALLARAQRLMQRYLDDAWAKRAPGLPYVHPDEVLVMASIVEKETGRPDERPMIASVFINRLRIGMRLQTDPTVIYGMGEGFDGNIRRRDLQLDTPYNTYTRSGLPPTPIAMPGRAALMAAVQPQKTRALYFVSRGDGSHQFSTTLDEHNRAVNHYQKR